jgi:hypothetical protein
MHHSANAQKAMALSGNACPWLPLLASALSCLTCLAPTRAACWRRLLAICAYLWFCQQLLSPGNACLVYFLLWRGGRPRAVCSCAFYNVRQAWPHTLFFACPFLSVAGITSWHALSRDSRRAWWLPGSACGKNICGGKTLSAPRNQYLRVPASRMPRAFTIFLLGGTSSSGMVIAHEAYSSTPAFRYKVLVYLHKRRGGE